MSDFQIIPGLSAIADNYDALLCDAWGVVHNGVTLFDGVEEALSEFRRTRGPVFILTNAPRLSSVIPEQLDRLGLSRDAYDGVVTSGDATLAAIHSFEGKPAYKLGPDKDETIFSAFGIDYVALEDAAYILCTGLVDDETETPEDYADLLARAHELRLPMICANPDIVVRLGDRLIYCGGALAAQYEKLGGNVIMAGKPYSPIYDLARERLSDVKGDSPERVLCIGDGFQTDILGANRQDMDVVFVAGGISQDIGRGVDGRLDNAAVKALLDERGLSAVAGMDALKW